MARILITGGSGGLGYESAKELKEAGHDVVIGARNPEKGAKAAEELGVDWVLMDVSDDDSVTKSAAEVAERYGSIDVLVNNAGIAGPNKPVEEFTIADFEQIFQTNYFGAVRATLAFYPLLSKSENPVIVNVSSGMGSFAITADTTRLESQIITPAYSSSKAALCMFTTLCAKAWPNFRVNAVDPRSTKTNLMGGIGMYEVEEGVIPIVAAAQFGPDDVTGKFLDRDGEIPW